MRENLDLKPWSKIVVRLRDDGVIEIIPFDRLYSEVSRVFREKFGGWREENHEASKALIEEVKDARDKLTRYTS